MTTKITRHTTCTLTIDDIDLSFEVEDCFCPEDSDTVRWAEREEGGYNVAWLCVDDTGGAFDDYWQDRDSGTFREFDNQVDRDEFLNEMIEEHGTEHVFIVEKYEHGLVHYSPIGTRFYPDRQWDVAPCAVLVVPEDATKPEEYAKAALNEYSDWCNGSIFGVVRRAVTAEGDVIDEESEEVWGFIGYEYAQSNVEEAVKCGCL